MTPEEEVEKFQEWVLTLPRARYFSLDEVILALEAWLERARADVTIAIVDVKNQKITDEFVRDLAFKVKNEIIDNRYPSDTNVNFKVTVA